MSKPDSYIREMDSIDQELKRTNARLKILRNQKREKQTLLYKYIIKNKLDTYRGKSLASVRPREHYQRKTEAQKNTLPLRHNDRDTESRDSGRANGGGG